MVLVYLLERPTISITGTDNEFQHTVCDRQVLVKSSHVNSRHWKLGFCLLLEQNRTRTKICTTNEWDRTSTPHVTAA